MFTGIVEELGEVVGIDLTGDSARIRVRGPLVTGGCRSRRLDRGQRRVRDRDRHCGRRVQRRRDGGDAGRSSLGALHPGARVNLERPMRADGRLGGHIVQGHVDGTGTIVSRQPASDWETVRISIPAALVRYMVLKGSVAVDGISLTVSGLASTTTRRQSLVRGQPDPGDAGPHHAWAQAAGRRREHRGRRDRQVRGAAARRGGSSDQPGHDSAGRAGTHGDDAARRRRARGRRHRGRPAGRGGRRRRPGERGRHHLRRQQGHARRCWPS